MCLGVKVVCLLMLRSKFGANRVILSITRWPISIFAAP